MATRRFIIFTIILMMLAAAPVWANTANIPDLPRIESSVEIDGSLAADALSYSSSSASSCNWMMTCEPVVL